MKKNITNKSFKKILKLLAKQDPEEKLRIAFNLWQFSRDLQDKKINYDKFKSNSSRATA